MRSEFNAGAELHRQPAPAACFTPRVISLGEAPNAPIASARSSWAQPLLVTPYSRAPPLDQVPADALIEDVTET
jgi:hypothetical protein